MTAQRRQRPRVLGEVFVTPHAAERFVERIAPWLLATEATAVIGRLAATATLDQHTHKGQPAWWCENPPCFLVTKTDVGQGGGSIVVTVLGPEMEIGSALFHHRSLSALDKLALETSARSGDPQPAPLVRVETKEVVREVKVVQVIREQAKTKTVVHLNGQLKPTKGRLDQIYGGAKPIGWAERWALHIRLMERATAAFRKKVSLLAMEVAETDPTMAARISELRIDSAGELDMEDAS